MAAASFLSALTRLSPSSTPPQNYVAPCCHSETSDSPGPRVRRERRKRGEKPEKTGKGKDGGMGEQEN